MSRLRWLPLALLLAAPVSGFADEATPDASADASNTEEDNGGCSVGRRAEAPLLFGAGSAVALGGFLWLRRKR
jgi:hypothetical protein